MKKDVTKGTLCAVLSAIIFGVTPVLSSITFQLGSNPLTLTFYRNAMAVPVLLIMLLVSGVSLKISLKGFSLTIVRYCLVLRLLIFFIGRMTI